MSKSTARATEDRSRPSPARFMTRHLEGIAVIGLASRVWSAYCGGRDGALGVPLVTAGVDAPDAPERGTQASAELMTEFLRGIIHAYNECDEREFNASLASVVDEVQILRSLHDQIQRLELDLDAARKDAHRLAERPRITTAEIIRGPGERDTPEAVILARRQKPKDAQVAAGRANVAAMERRRAGLQTEFSIYAHRVRVVFESYVTPTGRARATSERICVLYRRAVVLHHEQGVRLQRLWAETSCVPVPPRTSAPCPWVPTEPKEEMATDAVH